MVNIVELLLFLFFSFQLPRFIQLDWSDETENNCGLINSCDYVRGTNLVQLCAMFVFGWEGQFTGTAEVSLLSLSLAL